MNKTSFTIIITLFAVVAFSITLCAQEQTFKVGDQVEIKNLSGVWVEGKVIGILNEGRLYYRVKLDDENAPNVYFNHALPGDLRPRGGAPAPLPNPKQTGQVVTPIAEAGTGETVDVYYDATHGWNRGSVVSRNGNRVTVRFNGCDRDEVVDRSQIHAPATIPQDAPDVRSVLGRWSLTKVGMSAYATAWGRAEGVQLNADGTYAWIQERGKAPVKGHWTTDAKVPGTDSGTQFYNGVLIKDSTGRDWKVLKWVVKGYPDGIQVQRMCSGEVFVGSRAR